MTKLVGIVNLTPDSFSQDGLQGNLNAILARIDALIKEGADSIDIGAESTRPGATTLRAKQEWERLQPVLESLGGRIKKTIFSVDTYHPETAQKAIALGAMINDVGAGTNPEMLTLAKDTPFIFMHSLGVPADSQKTIAPGKDPVEAVLRWAEELLITLDKLAIPRANIILDPGIGFGKTPEQSLALIRHVSRLQSLGVPLMVGHSRKSFLSLFTGKKAAERDPETLAVSYFLASKKVDYLRVHDVKSHAAMLRLQAAL